MSYAVLRGSPEKAQLYLDEVLDSVIQNGGACSISREGVNLTEILYYCLKTNPEAIHSINASTGEKFTNERILKRAVSLARALIAKCSKEQVILMLRNHEHMSALYYGLLLSGVVPFMMEPGSTKYEIRDFASLVTPRLVFCEPDRRDDVTDALRSCDVIADVVVADGASLNTFVEGYSDDFESYHVPELEPDATALILPTSGTTGLPKAAMLHHQGLVLQMASTWIHHSQFPQPTRLVFLLSTAQWLTHTIIMNCCPVYHVPILMSPKKITAEYFLEVSEKYRPTWVIFGPSLAAQIGHVGTPEQLSSLENIYVGGSPVSPDTVAPLKDKLSASASLLNGYGMTEAQGHVAVGKHGTPLTTTGKIINILKYRLVSSDGDVSKPYEKGELYLKGKCLFKGYFKNEAAYRESVTDGWLKTGDVVYTDEDGQIFFANRTKLGFKYFNHQIYPEEIEQVIGTVSGVQQSVVCGAETGPAAAVVLQPGCDVTRENIHRAVKSTLSEYKWLRGGIAFVPALPRTHSGKIHRANSLQLIQELIVKGECF